MSVDESVAAGRRRTGWWVAFGVSAMVNVVAVYAPAAGGGGLFAHADKLAHLLLFAVVGFTGRRAGVPGGLLLAVLVGHAVVSEAVQALTLPQRSGDAGDVGADVLGSLVGVWLGGGRRISPGRP